MPYIIRAITSLATSLNMVTTAEGVEDEAQRAQLKLQGCTEVQGYLFSKALPANELTNLRSADPGARRPETLTFLPSVAVPIGAEISRGMRKTA